MQGRNEEGSLREEVRKRFHNEMQKALIYILLFYTDCSSSSAGFSEACSAIC